MADRDRDRSREYDHPYGDREYREQHWGKRREYGDREWENSRDHERAEGRNTGPDEQWSRRIPQFGDVGPHRERFDREFENRGVHEGEWSSRRVGTDRGYRNTDPSGSFGRQTTVDRHEPGPYTGRGPKNWHRDEKRVLEDVNDALTRNPDVDATDVEVQLADCEVTLTGTVSSRLEKRAAEDCAWQVPGVRDVHNQLRVHERK